MRKTEGLASRRTGPPTPERKKIMLIFARCVEQLRSWEMKLITRQYEDYQVFFQGNGYPNATEIAKAVCKAPKDYLKSERTVA